MFLHIDKETKIACNDIVGVFDLDTTTMSAVSKHFLQQQQKQQTLHMTGSALPCSLILCTVSDPAAFQKKRKRPIAKQTGNREMKKKSVSYFTPLSSRILYQKICAQSEWGQMLQHRLDDTVP